MKDVALIRVELGQVCPLVLVPLCVGQVLVRHGLVQVVVHRRAGLGAYLAVAQTGCCPGVGLPRGAPDVA